MADDVHLFRMPERWPAKPRESGVKGGTPVIPYVFQSRSVVISDLNASSVTSLATTNLELTEFIAEGTGS